MRRVLLVCLGLAALSLLLPSEPSYDPWAWIVWGRETATLSLDTTGGPSWKPLPVFITTLFAPTGTLSHGLPPALWLLIARAGTLLALALAFKIAARLAGGGRQGWVAGAVAALALALTPEWLRYAAHGNEVPLALALLLWAVDRALDRDHRGALVLGFLACLLRPEAVVFVAAHAGWLCREKPRARLPVAGLALALVALWVGPEWVGSGHPFDASNQARSEPSWSLARAAHPWLAALARAHELTGPALELGWAGAIAIAWRERRGRDARVVLLLGGAGLAWVALIVAMTQLGFSGSARYFVPAVACAGLLTGVAVGRLVGVVGAATAAPRRPARLVAFVPALLALAVVGQVWLSSRTEDLQRQARAARQLAASEAGLARTVAGIGGPEAVVQRGAPRVARAFQPRLAWEARLTLGEVERADGPGLHFRVHPRPPALADSARCTWPGAAGGWCVTEVGRRQGTSVRSPSPRGPRTCADRDDEIPARTAFSRRQM